MAEDRIRVNAICPGYIATPLTHTGDPAPIQRAFAKSQPWPDFGRGEHIAGTALFLASDDSEFVTGEAIVVDGGAPAEGPGRSRRFPKMSAKKSRYSGVTKGSTGASNDLRKLSSTATQKT